MSADHRKPFLAFVVLAFAAAAIIGVQRADAQPGRFLAAVVSTTVRVHGTLPAGEVSLQAARHGLVSLGPALAALGEHAPAFVRPMAGPADTSAHDEASHARWDRETGPARDREPSGKAHRGRANRADERPAGRSAEALTRAHDSAGASAEKARRGVREAAEALEKVASKVARRAPEVSGHSPLRRMLARAGTGR